MKVILLETVPSLGNIGQIVNVKPGFARNFLLPKSKAVLADNENVKQVQHRERILAKRIDKAKTEAEKAKTAIEAKTIEIVRKSAGEDKLFGSVTSIDIQKAIESLGFPVSRKGIMLANPIKKTGNYTIALKLDGNVEANLKIEVKAEPAEEEEGNA